MSAPVERAQSLLARGWMVLVVIVMLAALTVGEAYLRNVETAQLNQETTRLSDCNRQVIDTINDRSKFTSQFDGLADQDRANERRFWAEIAAAGQDRQRAREAFEAYRGTQAEIQKRREAVVRARDKHKFPSLAECQ